MTGRFGRGRAVPEFGDEGLAVGEDEPRETALLDLGQFRGKQVLEGGLVELSIGGHEAAPKAVLHGAPEVLDAVESADNEGVKDLDEYQSEPICRKHMEVAKLDYIMEKDNLLAAVRRRPQRYKVLGNLGVCLLPDVSTRIVINEVRLDTVELHLDLSADLAEKVDKVALVG